VCHSNDCALVLLKMLLKPQHTLSVKVVCRLVEQQQVRFFEQQQLTQRNSPLFRRQKDGSPLHRLAGIAAHPWPVSS
jgi:hypothetical protein